MDGSWARSGENDMSVLDGNPAIPNQICSLLLGCKAWLPSLYTRKQDLSSLETKKALQDYLQKPRWGGWDFPGNPVVKTSRFQGVKVWSLVRELRSYTLNLAKGGKNAILKNKTKRGGLWASQGWNWDPAELTSYFSFLFPTKLSIKTNTFLSHAQLFFLEG